MAISDMGRPDPTRVGAQLLAYLRQARGAPDVAYVAAPSPIAIGAETWVYGLELCGAPADLAGPLVLRVFPTTGDPVAPLFEQVVQNTLADLGYPAPRAPLMCRDAAVLGGPFLLMVRLPGLMMLDNLFRDGNVLLHAPRLIRHALTRLPRMLAEAQRRLHRLDPGPLRRALEAAGIPEERYTVAGWLADIAGRVEQGGFDGLRPGVRWLQAHPPSAPTRPVICHADFLPPNLLVDGDRAVGVIDWSHTTLADPSWDVANTRLRLAHNPLPLPRPLQGIAALVRRRVTRAYDAWYRAGHAIDERTLLYHEVLLALWFLVEIAEQRERGGRPVDDGRSPNLWLEPGAARPLLRLCRRATGCTLALPPIGRGSNAGTGQLQGPPDSRR